MEVTLLYFDGCPSWMRVDEALAQIASERPDVRVTRRRVDTVDEAELLQFHGSPTVLVDGVDPFPAPGATVGLTCRLYRTPDGLTGAPTPGQLRDAIVGRGGAGLDG